jgi:YhcH/YjgK/YiaL family protein
MILDAWPQHARHTRLYPGLELACEFLAQPAAALLQPGRYALDGDRVYVTVAEEQGRPVERARLEAHRRYIDVQTVMAGEERIGWRPLARCAHVTAEYDPARDVAFYGDQAETLLEMTPGLFAVFFPEDAHMPLIGAGRILKAVAKIRVA